MPLNFTNRFISKKYDNKVIFFYNLKIHQIHWHNHLSTYITTAVRYQNEVQLLQRMMTNHLMAAADAAAVVPEKEPTPTA